MTIRRFFVLIVTTCLAMLRLVQAQLVVEVQFPASLKGWVELEVFDNGDASRLISKKVHGKRVVFRDTLSAPSPLRLQLKGSEPLWLFADNEVLQVRYNVESPSSSPVVGSRWNSMFRYVLEQSRENNEGDILAQGDYVAHWVAQNLASPLSAWLLCHTLFCINPESASSLAASLEGDAKQGAAYRLLVKKVSEQQSAVVGTILSRLSYTNTNGNKVPLDTIVSTGTMSVLVFDPDWHNLQTNFVANVSKELQSVGCEVRLIHIAPEREVGGWDSKVFTSFAVDRVPYMIIVDAEGRIVARDVRLWELARLCKDACAK